MEGAGEDDMGVGVGEMKNGEWRIENGKWKVENGKFLLPIIITRRIGSDSTFLNHNKK
jgi:hypothetical protein